ncbi:MAG: hypothetical protein ACR5LA_08355 [Wolbachia sp.]
MSSECLDLISPYDGVIPVLDTGIQTLIVILVNKSGKNKRSSQNAVFLLK